MFSRSVAASLRTAVARPAVPARAFAPAAVRFNSNGAAKEDAKKEEAGEADESAKKIAELEAKVKEQEVSVPPSLAMPGGFQA